MNEEFAPYRPSADEQKAAEAALTPEQDQQTLSREYLARKLQLETDTNESEQNQLDTQLQEAEMRGERILELNLPISVRLSAAELVRDTHNYLPNIVHAASSRLETRLLEELRKQHPEVIDDVRAYQDSKVILEQMLRSKDVKTVDHLRHPELHDSSRARAILQERQRILQRYGGDVALDRFHQLASEELDIQDDNQD